jgi:hypothetical protein
MEELDEFGIPIKKAVKNTVDEYGIPIKKKKESTAAAPKLDSAPKVGSLDGAGFPKIDTNSVAPGMGVQPKAKTVVKETKYAEGTVAWNHQKMIQNNPDYVANYDKFKQVKNVSDAKKLEIAQDNEDEFNGKGIWNNIKSFAIDAADVAIQGLGSIADMHAGDKKDMQLEKDPFADQKAKAKKEFQEQIAVAKKNKEVVPVFTSADIDKRAKEIKLKERIDSQSETQIKDYLAEDNSNGQVKKDSYQSFAIGEYSTIQENDKVLLEQQNIERNVIKGLSGELKDLENKFTESGLTPENLKLYKEKNNSLVSIKAAYDKIDSDFKKSDQYKNYAKKSEEMKPIAENFKAANTELEKQKLDIADAVKNKDSKKEGELIAVFNKKVKEVNAIRDQYNNLYESIKDDSFFNEYNKNISDVKAKYDSAYNQVKALSKTVDKSNLASTEYEAKYKKYQEVVAESIKTHDKYVSNRKNLGKATENLDILKRDYGSLQSFIGNVDAITSDLTAGMIGVVDYGLEAKKNILGYQTGNDIYLQKLAQGVVKDLKLDSDRTRAEIMKPIAVENINNLSDLGDWFFQTAIAQQVPIFGLIATGTFGVSAIGLSSGGQRLNDMRGEMERGENEYSDRELMLQPVGFAITETASAVVDLMILKNAARVVSSATRGERQMIVDGFVKRTLKVGEAMTKGTVYEGGDEGLTQGLQNLMLGKPFTEDMLDPIAAGAAMGLLMPFGGNIIAQAIKPFATDTKIQQASAEILNLQKELDKPNLNIETRRLLQDNLVKTQKKVELLVKKQLGKIEVLSKEQFQEIVKSEKTQANIKNQAEAIKLDDNISDETKKQLLENLREEFKATNQRRIDLLQRGASVVMEQLGPEQSKRLKDLASRRLMKEQNPDGTKSITLNDEEISRTALQIHNAEVKERNLRKARDKELREREIARQEAAIVVETPVVETPKMEEVVTPVVENEVVVENIEGQGVLNEVVAPNVPELDIKIERGGIFSGEFLNEYEFLAEGSEHTVYRSKDGKTVIKIGEPHNSNETYQARVDDALAINSLLGDGSLEVIGTYRSPNGTINPVYRQNFTDGKTATQEQVAEHLINNGFTQTGKDTFTINKDGKTLEISDTSDNFIINVNGDIIAIDAAIREIQNESTPETNTPTNGDVQPGVQPVGESGVAKPETPAKESVPSPVDGGEAKGNVEVEKKEIELEKNNVILQNGTTTTNEVQPESTGNGGTGRATISKTTPLQGAPTVQGATGPDSGLVSVAEKYANDNGIDLARQGEYVEVDEDRARRIANAYEEMANDPQNPKVKEAYAELIRQTKAQYQALVDAGYEFWFIDLNNPANIEYISSPFNAMRDLRQQKKMGVFPTEEGFGSNEGVDVSGNPLLADTGIMWAVGGLNGVMKPVTANDLFRAVHDAFGHGLEGSGFRAQGEENAWQAHSRLYTGTAIGAMTSETRGQNSWVNYGPNGEANKTASAEDTVFADQKVGLMPEFTWTEGRASDMIPETVKPTETPKPAAKKPAAKKTAAKKTAAERIEANNANVDDFKNAIKGIDNIFGIKIKVDDIDGLNSNGIDIIDVIANIVKQAMAAGIQIDEAISKTIEHLKKTMNFSVDIDAIKERINPKQTESTEDLENFRDSWNKEPSSGEINQYDSGNTILREHGMLRNDQDYEIQKDLARVQIGIKALEHAKRLFGAQYVEKTLAFIEQANLSPEKKAVAYVLLENEMDARAKAFPDNVGIQKLQDLVRAKSQAFLANSARAMGAGRFRVERFRELAQKGFTEEEFTNAALTTQQIKDKAKIKEIAQVSPDDINKEAESQEKGTNVDSDLKYTQEDFDRELEKAKDELGKDYNISVFENLKRQAKKDKLSDKKEVLKDAKTKVLEDIRRVIRESRGEMSANPIGKPLEFAALVTQLAKIYIQEGALSLEDVANNIFNELKDMSKDISKADILNVLKSKPKKATTEATKRKAYINLLNKNIESLDEQIEAKKKTDIAKVDKYKNDAEIKDLRDTRSAKQEELARIDPNYAASRKLRTDLKLAQKSLDEYQRRIDEGDLSVKSKSPKAVADVLKRLRDARDAKRKTFQEAKKKYDDSQKEPVVPPTQEELADKKYLADIKRKTDSLKERIKSLKENKPKSNDGKNSAWNEEVSQLETELKGLIEEKRDALRKKPLTEEEIYKRKVDQKIKQIEKQITDLEENKPEDNNDKNSVWTAEISDLKNKLKKIREAKKQLTEQEDNQNKADQKIKQLEREVSNLEQNKPVNNNEKSSVWNAEISDLKAKIKALKEAKSQEAKNNNPKEIVKKALIDKGFFREVNVNGEVRKTLDWKKLAGEAGTIENIRRNVEESLRDSGYSDIQIEAMQDVLEREYVRLSEDVIEKGLNELQNRNKDRKPVNTKSAARKLAELSNYGLFDKDKDSYEKIINSILGFNELDQKTFEGMKQIAKGYAVLMDSGLSDIEIKDAINTLSRDQSRLVATLAFSQGNWKVKLANVLQELAGLSTRFKLVNLGNLAENLSSGMMARGANRMMDAMANGINGEKTSNKALKNQSKINARAKVKGITFEAAESYGDTSSLLLNHSAVEDYFNKATDSKVHHAIISTYMAKPLLEGADSYNKILITEAKMVRAALRVLQAKGMSNSEALDYVANALTGESMQEALVKAKDLIDKVNKDSGKKLLNDSDSAVKSLAADIVKESLVSGGQLSQAELKAIYTAAYKSAGKDIGHVSNNWVTDWVSAKGSQIEKRVEEAIKEKNWDVASGEILNQAFWKNFVSTFVGGGTNWYVKGLQKTANPLSLISLREDYSRLKMAGDLDVTSEDGVKKMEEVLYRSMNLRSTGATMVMGALITSSIIGAMMATGADDEIEKWLKENQWAKKYFDKMVPDAVVLMLAINDKDYGRYIAKTINVKADFFDDQKNIGKILENYATGYVEDDAVKISDASGDLGAMLGKRFEFPGPLKAAKDIKQIYKGIAKNKYDKTDYYTSGFLNGFFQGGMVEGFGLRKSPDFDTNSEEYKVTVLMKERTKKGNRTVDEKVKDSRSGSLSSLEGRVKELERMILTKEMNIPYYNSAGNLQDLNEMNVASLKATVARNKAMIAAKRSEFGIKEKEE